MKASGTAPDFYRVVEAAVRKAVVNPENLNEDGKVVWNFVDSDVYMSINPSRDCVDLFYDLFNEACDVVEDEINFPA